MNKKETEELFNMVNQELSELQLTIRKEIDETRRKMVTIIAKMPLRKTFKLRKEGNHSGQR